MTADSYERDLEPTIESIGIPPGTDLMMLSGEDRTAYIRWVQDLGRLPEDVRFSLLVWILRSVVAPREHYGKDADTKPDEVLSLIEWIADKTGLNVEALVAGVEEPSVWAIQRLKAPVTIPKVD